MGNINKGTKVSYCCSTLGKLENIGKQIEELKILTCLDLRYSVEALKRGKGYRLECERGHIGFRMPLGQFEIMLEAMVALEQCAVI